MTLIQWIKEKLMPSHVLGPDEKPASIKREAEQAAREAERATIEEQLANYEARVANTAARFERLDIQGEVMEKPSGS